MDPLDSVGGDEAEHEEQVAAVMERGRQQGLLDIFASIAGLTRLKSLDVTGMCHVATSIGRASGLVPGDPCALTVLTGLTHLDLSSSGACVDNAAAAALAHSLKEMRILGLCACELGSMACLEAIADLPQLSDLNLRRNPGITHRGLMALTRLSCVQSLAVTRNDEVTDASVDDFLLDIAWSGRSSSKKYWAPGNCYEIVLQ
uniref:Uncharacterized protein n=1 Tax=Tetradesmus obliquus TaxID=3088 RepID=A0A383VGR9_TETOB|eukprot:jgi/Sobl393_1/16482/SZX63864.1